MRRRGAALVVLAALALTSCTHRYADQYINASVIKHGTPVGFTVVAGQNHILVYHYERMILPVPDSVSGFWLFVTLSPESVKPGAVVALPHPAAHAALSKLRAPGYDSTQNVTGTVHIRSVTADCLHAKLDLKSSALRWSYSGVVTFLTNELPFRRGWADDIRSNCALERTTGSRSLAAAAQRGVRGTGWSSRMRSRSLRPFA